MFPAVPLTARNLRQFRVFPNGVSEQFCCQPVSVLPPFATRHKPPDIANGDIFLPAGGEPRDELFFDLTIKSDAFWQAMIFAGDFTKLANSSQSHGPSVNLLPSVGSDWLMPIMGLSQDTSQVAAGFHSRNTTLAPMEQQDLKIRGYSDEEIAHTVRALQEHNVEPTHADVRLSLTREATEQPNEHYQSLWPEPRVIAAIVDRWPVQLQEQVNYIKSHWPKLSVCGMKFTFTSTSEVCSNDYGRQLSPLGYRGFFRLVKDIWFHAVSTSNTCIINRISHLLISFAKEIANNTYTAPGEGRSRRERFKSVIHQELERGISSTYDIGAFAFLLAAWPPLWRKHNSETLRLMANRAFNGQEEKLAPYYSQWQSRSRQDQVSKTVELEIIPSVAMAMHYLYAIHDYLIKHKSKMRHITSTEYWQISDGDYFDKVTHQLAHPIPAPKWRISHPLPVVKKALCEFYANPIYQYQYFGQFSEIGEDIRQFRGQGQLLSECPEGKH